MNCHTANQRFKRFKTPQKKSECKPIRRNSRHLHLTINTQCAVIGLLAYKAFYHGVVGDNIGILRFLEYSKSVVPAMKVRRESDELGKYKVVILETIADDLDVGLL
uniref:Pentatricopeptide repeat-containing protein At3g29230-like n=1 Tax=Rhizophora mucronata TaxID=61149 RepID=A0A2P2MZJ0_RHIMU